MISTTFVLFLQMRGTVCLVILSVVCAIQEAVMALSIFSLASSLNLSCLVYTYVHSLLTVICLCVLNCRLLYTAHRLLSALSHLRSVLVLTSQDNVLLGIPNIDIIVHVKVIVH